MPFKINYIQLSPAEIFTSSFKIALFFGLYVVGPFILYSVFKYFLSKREMFSKKNTNIMLLKLFIAFSFGVLAGYFFLLPMLFYFLLGFNIGVAIISISISSYVTFCLSVLLFTGLLFSIPVISKMVKSFKLEVPDFSWKQLSVIAIGSSALFIFPTELFSIMFFALMLLALWQIFKLVNEVIK
jgi:Sec-independent protein secretion pathway component TatC